MEYHVRLPVFEGPFQLLFHLVEKAEVDICEISLADITAQYLATLRAMRELNLDLASEFIVMAATLLKLKSKKLLPDSPIVDCDELDEGFLSMNSQEELVERLLEYRYFRSVAEELKRCEQAQKRVFVRSLCGEKVVLVNPEEDLPAAGIMLPALLAAFQRLLAERERQPQEVATDEFSVRDKMREIMRMLAASPLPLEFASLFPEGVSVAEIIVTFFALLELIRLKKISVWQDGPLGSLTLARRKIKRGEERSWN